MKDTDKAREYFENRPKTISLKEMSEKQISEMFNQNLELIAENERLKEQLNKLEDQAKRSFRAKHNTLAILKLTQSRYNQIVDLLSEIERLRYVDYEKIQSILTQVEPPKTDKDE